MNHLDNKHSGNKYLRPVLTGIKDSDGTLFIDVYSVLEAFEVGHPALQHAIKKLLVPGGEACKNV